jgi:heterokaryon incompatibility protein (HET)
MIFQPWIACRGKASIHYYWTTNWTKLTLSSVVSSSESGCSLCSCMLRRIEHQYPELDQDIQLQLYWSKWSTRPNLMEAITVNLIFEEEDNQYFDFEWILALAPRTPDNQSSNTAAFIASAARTSREHSDSLSSSRLSFIASNRGPYANHRVLHKVETWLRRTFKSNSRKSFIEANRQSQISQTAKARVQDPLEIHSRRSFIEGNRQLQITETAKGWLRNCLESHSLCRNKVEPENSDKYFMPKRLLRLRENKVHLVEWDSKYGSSSYATLSHCWGKNPNFITLTASNLQKFEKEIPIPELPKTFRDAVQITRSLGIDLLWIDSLTILQSGPGSNEDWLQHIHEMTLIYKNCTINISADHASGPTEGCYSPENAMALRYPFIDDAPIDENMVCIAHSREAQIPSKSILPLPLSGRAWVVQERLLSPRVLHFGAAQMFWECNELEWATESFPEGYPNYLFSPPDYGPPPFSIEIPTSRDTIKSNSSITLWHRVVERYSTCALTRSEDKLSALAGVARYIGEQINDNYFAGCFELSMLQSLLWQPESGTGVKRMSDPYRAPSWSWASVDGIVKFIYKRSWRYSAEIKAVEVDLKDPQNVYGPINRASMTIEGPLMVFPSVYVECRCSMLQGGGYDVKNMLKFRFTGKDSCDSCQEFFLDDPLVFKPENGLVGILQLASGKVASLHVVRGLSVTDVLSERTDWEDRPDWDGLILQKGKTLDVWRRVGYISQRALEKGSLSDFTSFALITTITLI